MQLSPSLSLTEASLFKTASIIVLLQASVRHYFASYTLLSFCDPNKNTIKKIK